MKTILIFAFFILMLLCLFKNKKVNLNSPLPFLWSTWSIVIILCYSKIFPEYGNISNLTLIYVVLFLILTSAAFKIGGRVLINNHIKSYSLHRLLISFNFLFGLVVLAYLCTIIIFGLPPAFTGESRSNYYLPNGGELIYLLIYPCFFLGLILLKRVNIKYVLPQLLILFVLVLTRGNKTAIFSLALMLFYLYGKKTKPINIVYFLLFLVVIFYLSTLMYTKNIQDKALLRNTKLLMTGFTLPMSLYFLYDPMAYFASNLFNLNSLVVLRLGFFGKGVISFKSLAQVFGILFSKLSDFTSNAKSVMDSSLPIPLFNTYSGLGTLYFDFGIIISIIIFILIAFSLGAIYSSKEKKGITLSNDFLGFLLFQTLAVSFFTFYLGDLEVITNLIVMYLIDLFARQTRNG